MNSYLSALKTRPVLTKSAAATVIFGVGGLLAQCVLANGFVRPDVLKLAHVVAWGGVVFAPLNHCWFHLLDSKIRRPGLSTFAIKIALDQLVWTPPMLFAFFLSMSLLQGYSWDYAPDRALHKLPIVLQISWVVWPLLRFLGATNVPPRYRVLWLNFWMIPWVTYLVLLSSV
eukprot:TRINITY_DN80782_c0_g1_i1.p1 TRINITY_DN80782_c0_g1~~TRINITY_DN80782_c0_g1_i1.p1  ORF type:complete len:172 (+),score=8.06 TRINITY_DN80782_c0_g1_i1:66-581(+)